MKIKSVLQLKTLKKRRVILRCDLNASLAGSKLEYSDLWRLQSVVPTIEYLTKRGASVIIIAHRGRPNGYDHDLLLEPIVKQLSKLLHRDIAMWNSDLDVALEKSRIMKAGEVVALENIRFFQEEEKNSALFGKKLAKLGDIYVNDAFGNIHRAHASMVAITKYIPSYAGLLLEHELGNLLGLLDKAKKPIVAVIGGSKISTKIRLIKRLMRRVDYVLLGGALANNVLAAMEHNVGKSKVEHDMIEWSKGLLDNKLKVPVDARVATSLKAKPRIEAVGDVKKNDIILDLGPDTVALYEDIISTAKTVIWNGPLGLFEDPRYAKATNKMVKVLAESKTRSYVGGGETVKAILAQHREDQIHFISTGGGAMLALLEGRPLAALRPLTRK